MTPPLTAERALEMARGIVEADIYEVEDVALFALRSAAAEASEEVCVCGHHKSTHGEFADPFREDYPCTYCDCRQFLSRRAFLEKQVKELEKG